MTDTKDLFRSLDDVTAPDVWDRVGEPPTRRPIEHEPHRRRPVLAAVAALAVTAAIVGVLVVAFRPDDSSSPGQTTSPSLAIARARTDLVRAQEDLEAAVEAGDPRAIDEAAARLKATRAALRELLETTPLLPVTNRSSVEEQVAGMIQVEAGVTLELVVASDPRATDPYQEGLEPYRASLEHRIDRLQERLAGLCAQLDPAVATALGCGGSGASSEAQGTLVRSGGTYLLSDFSLTFPVQSDAPGNDVLYAEVSFHTEWSSAFWPGEADCEFRLFDRAGRVVASETMGFSVDGPISDRTRVSVEVPMDAKTPVAAEGECGPGMVFDGSSQYVFSSMVVDDGKILGDVRWSAGTPVGYAACGFLVTGADESVRFTVIGLGVGEGQQQVLGLVGDAWPEDGTVEARCEPYRSPEQFRAGYWLPWEQTDSSPDALEGLPESCFGYKVDIYAIEDGVTYEGTPGDDIVIQSGLSVYRDNGGIDVICIDGGAGSISTDGAPELMRIDNPKDLEDAVRRIINAEPFPVEGRLTPAEIMALSPFDSDEAVEIGWPATTEGLEARAVAWYSEQQVADAPVADLELAISLLTRAIGDPPALGKPPAETLYIHEVVLRREAVCRSLPASSFRDEYCSATSVPDLSDQDVPWAEPPG